MGKKISLGACEQAGDVGILIYCVSQRPAEKAPPGGGANVCGHLGEMEIGEAVRLFGAETSLSDLRLKCSKCGGKDIDVRGKRPPTTEGGLPLSRLR